jgi:hypothetical protein
MIFKSQFFLISSFLYVLLDSHRNFHVQGELTKIIFLLFGCGIMLYMLTHVFFLIINKSKTNSFSDNL